MCSYFLPAMAIGLKGVKNLCLFLQDANVRVKGKGAVFLLKAFNTFVPSGFLCISTQCEFCFQMWELCWRWNFPPDPFPLDLLPWWAIPGCNDWFKLPNPAQWLWQCVPANPYSPNSSGLSAGFSSLKAWWNKETEISIYLCLLFCCLIIFHLACHKSHPLPAFWLLYGCFYSLWGNKLKYMFSMCSIPKITDQVNNLCFITQMI